jgi:hypothetical protein
LPSPTTAAQGLHLQLLQTPLGGRGGAPPCARGPREGAAPCARGATRRGRAREGGGGVARRGEEGEGKREREGEGSSPRGPNPAITVSKGHHMERERWRIGGCYAGKSNERKGEKGRGRAWGRGRAPGAGGPERAGWDKLGRVGSQAGTEAPNTRDHRSESKSWNKTKQNTRLSTTSDKEI